jgi:hypothetical protein
VRDLVHPAIGRAACGASPAIRRPRPGRTTTPDARAILSSLSRPAVLILALFHGWLFWNRMVDGRFLEPAVAFRWIAGALILAGFLALRRLGASSKPGSGGIAESANCGSTGRKSLVLWLFVVLLHCQAIGASPGAGFDPALVPGTVAALSANLAFFSTATALGFALLARPRRGGAARLLAFRGVAVRAPAPAAPAAGFLPQVSSRPPPA